jgi:hypothetical protein
MTNKGATEMKTIHDKLSHAVTAYDIKQEMKARRNPRACHNVHALSQYLLRVDDIIADIAAGASVDAAICAGFTPGALRTACLKACGFAASTVESSGSYKGLPVYKPASSKE